MPGWMKVCGGSRREAHHRTEMRLRRHAGKVQRVGQRLFIARRRLDHRGGRLMHPAAAALGQRPLRRRLAGVTVHARRAAMRTARRRPLATALRGQRSPLAAPLPRSREVSGQHGQDHQRARHGPAAKHGRSGTPWRGSTTQIRALIVGPRPGRVNTAYSPIAGDGSDATARRCTGRAPSCKTARPA